MRKASSETFMVELHLWMQAWSDQDERILVRVESVGKVERSTLAVDCTEADFRTFETALYQVSHRTTTNEPLRMVQEVQGQKGLDALHSSAGDTIRETRQTEARRMQR